MQERAIRHSDGSGWSVFAAGTPAQALRGQVLGYAGYREHAAGQLVRRELPAPVASLIISFGPALEVVGQGERTSFVAGVHESPATTRFAGDQHGVQVELRPTAARRLLGVPMDTVGLPVVALDDVLGRTAPRLAEQLAEAPDWDARFTLLDAELTRALADAPAPRPEVEWAFGRLVTTRGRTPVAALTAELGWSDRRLLRAFRDQVGVPPTTLARMLRFRHAVERLRAGERDLGRVALDCGFYDQAHFNRDFRAFAGGPPTDYLRRLLPEGLGVDGSVQDEQRAAA